MKDQILWAWGFLASGAAVALWLRARFWERQSDLWREKAGEAERLAEERLAHANQLQADIEAEIQGRLALRKRLGAREDETMGAFLERLATMAGVALLGEGKGGNR